MRSTADILKYTLVLLMFILFIYTSYFMPSGSIPVPGTTGDVYYPEVKTNGDAWYGRVVTADELLSTDWIRANTNKSDKFVADIWGAEMIMGMTTRVSTTGGDWANAHDPGRMMEDTNNFYMTGNATEAHDLALEEHATLAYVPNRYTNSGYGWQAVSMDKFNDTQYFQLLYQNPDVSIYKVLT